MKKKVVFFTFSSDALRQNKTFYLKLAELIEKECKYLIKYRWFKNTKKKTAEQIYLNSISAIREADIFIAEATTKSTSVGQQIGYAVQQKKPCFILLKTELQGVKRTSFTKGTRLSNVFFIYYSNLEDLQTKLCNKILLAKDSKFEKFNFIITKRIKKILHAESRKRNITQSELLREIVEDWISNHYSIGN